MKTFATGLLGVLLIGAAWAADGALTPEMQATLDAQKKVIVAWAADPVLVATAKAQNETGPIPGMDDAAWKATKPGDAVVKAFQENAAGAMLSEKLKASDGMFTEAFLNAAKGEKAAFVEKTTSYIHAGSEKFDVPMTGKDWQGRPEFDESSKTHAVQISTPVLEDGKPIGALVVGVSLRKLSSK